MRKRSEPLAEMPAGMSAVDMTDKPSAEKRRRDGSVQRETFDRVEALVRQGHTKASAFGEIAAELGKKTGAVQAAYYAASKKRRNTSPSTATSSQVRAAAKPAGARTSRTTADGQHGLDQVLAALVANVRALSDAIQSERTETAALRSRLDGLKAAL